MVIPLFVGRDKSKALDAAMTSDKQILLVAQKNAEVDDPSIKDLHDIGTLANDPAAAEAAGWHREGAGGGASARQGEPLRLDR